MAPKVISEALHQANHREHVVNDYAALASKKLSHDPYHIQKMQKAAG